MSADNPFSKLAALKIDADKKNGQKTLGKRQKSSIKASAANELDDMALFLSAVASAQPLSKESSTSADEDADMFNAALSSLLRKETAKKKGAASTVASTEQHPAQSENTAQRRANTRSAPQQGEQLAEIEDIVMSTHQNEEEDIFSKAMAGVKPVATKGRDMAKPAEQKETLVPPSRNVMQDILDGRIEFTLSHSDEYMEGHVVGMDPLVMGRLRAGEFSPEAYLDLHGQNAEQAYEALTFFLKNAYQRNMRTVLIITGRGKNSPGGVSVIRGMLHVWLTKDPFKRVVLGFCSARQYDGGAGALYVMLRKYKKNRGKIRWDIPYHGPDMGK